MDDQQTEIPTEIQTKYAYILLTRVPHPLSLIMMNEMATNDELYADYTFYVMVDNNQISLDEWRARFPKIQFLQIADEECHQARYINMTYSIFKTPVSWDKAFYYFTYLQTEHQQIWFIEDDVFVPTSKVIATIDKKYEEDGYHLMTSMNDVKVDRRLMDWNWHLAVNRIPLPWCRSMVCACRVSRTLLEKIREYVEAAPNRTLFFLEIMINSIAFHCQLKNKVCPELSGIVYRKDWKLAEMNPNGLYHPVKNINLQYQLYQIFNPSSS